MTIIAYRDGCMASDSRMVAGWTVTSDNSRKIFKTKHGDLVGGAGRAAIIQLFLEWLDSDRTAPRPPLHDTCDPKESATSIMVVRKNGQIEEFGVAGHLQLNVDFHAIGSGSDLALGAMEMDATVQEAVMVAIKRNMACGGAVQTLWLDRAAKPAPEPEPPLGSVERAARDGRTG